MMAGSSRFSQPCYRAAITNVLILGNRNFIPDVTSVEKLYEWGPFTAHQKFVTKFVHLIGCQIDFFKMPKNLFSP